MSNSESIQLLINNLDGPSKWIQEGQIRFSKNFDIFKLEKDKLLDFEDTHRPIYSIAKMVIGAHILIQGYHEANKKMLIELIAIFSGIEEELKIK